eukprot:m.139613 g.139613  ORF g.139613 m.139613 type:complete len:387 (-) comp16091_c1_seq1:1056-2216(-)
MDDDVISITSALSSATLGSQSSDADGVDISTPLLEIVNLIVSKRQTDRHSGVIQLQELLRRHVIPHEVLAPRQDELEQGLKRCVKLDADNLTEVVSAEVLLCVQLPEDDIHHHFDNWRDVLETTVFDYTLEPEPRAAAVQALAMLSVLGNVPVDECLELIDLCTEVVEDDTVPPLVVAAALTAWSLLLARLPLREACSRGRKQAFPFHRLMQADGTSQDVTFAAGEALVLIGDAIYNMDDAPLDLMHEVAEAFEVLATENSKTKSKKNLKAQRLRFRQLLQGLQTGRCPKTSITIDPFHSLDIATWSDLRVYHAFRDLLQGGFLHHLRDNLSVRTVFELGAPTLKSRRITQEEKAELRALHADNTAARQADRRAARASKQDFGGHF